MKKGYYKFENYPDLNFPVYSSVQKNNKILVCPHFHDDAELFKILSGKVYVYAGTQKHLCSQGDIIFLPPGIIHEVVSDSQDASIQGLVFNPSVLKQNIIYSPLHENCYIFRPDNIFYSDIELLFKKSTEVYGNKPETFKLEITAYLLLITSVLMQCKIIEFPEKSTEISRIKPAIDYISENFSKKISISELSGILCVCDDHFIRLFKAATSRTPAEYIVDYRITQAMKMLTSDKYSVSEIACLTGFSNSCYFCKIFKQKLNITPSEYRKKSMHQISIS